MVDKLPHELTSGISNRGSTVHASDKTNTNLSRGHTEEDISRLQSAVKAFDASFTYKVGDLVLQGGIERRCITTITVPAPFNPAEWTDIQVAGISFNGTPFTITVTTADTLVPATNAGWVSDSNTSGFTLASGPVTGLFTYNGPTGVVVLLNYASNVSVVGGGNQGPMSGIFKNGTELPLLRNQFANPGANNETSLSGTLIISLTTGDTFQFGGGNFEGTGDATLHRASITLVKIK